MPELNDAEYERVLIVISKLSPDHLREKSDFPAAVAAAMEIATIFQDMSGRQKRALVVAVMNKIAQDQVPTFTPYLPLVETFCDTIMHAAKHELDLHAAGRCFPCLSRSSASGKKKTRHGRIE